MKRKGGCPVEPQHGACGIWLDASALKKRKLQTVMPLRVRNRQVPYFPPARSPLPCTKQTTISTFFSVLQAGEKSTSTSQRLLAVASSAPLPEDHELPQDLCFLPPASAPAQSDSKGEDAALDKAALAEGKDFLSSDCAGEKGLLGHPKAARSPLRGRNTAQGFWCSKSQQLSPHTVVHVARPGGPLPSWRDDCLTEAAELENVDPQLQGCGTEVRGSEQPWRPQREVCTSRYEEGQRESQAEPPAPLFSQDSEGRTVISHRSALGRGKRPLQRKPLRNQSSNSSTGLLDSSQQLHYDLLFTEDSEGNRVIKH